MLKSISSEELAPPPSDEDIFGQIETIKKQFEHENSQLNRQLEENKVTKQKYKCIDIDNNTLFNFLR